MPLPASDQYRVDTLKNIGKLSLGAMGIAGAVRGLRGIVDTYRGAHDEPPKVPLRQQFLSIPVPRQKEANGPYGLAAASIASVKEAAGPLQQAAEVPGLAQKALDFVGGLKRDGKNWGPLKETVFNSQAQSPVEMPWALPALATGVLGAGYLGYKGVDSALGASKKNETESELNEAKSRYERALMPKAASTEYPALERLCDLIEKQANSLGWLNAPLGAYATAAGALAVGSGVGTYNWAKAHSEDKAVASALKKRREQMFAGGPTPIFAVPEEVDPEASPRLGMADLAARLREARSLPKAASMAQAADTAMAKFDQQEKAVAARTAAIFGGEKAAPKPVKPGPPAPPQLPSVVNRPA